MPLCQPCAGCRPNHCARYTPCMVLDVAASAVSERLYCSTEAAEAEPALVEANNFRLCARHRRPPAPNASAALRAAFGAGPLALRITGPVADGFFVRALTVLAQARWARHVGLPISVAYRSPADAYASPGAGSRDGFSHYFEPPAAAAAVPPGARLVQLECAAAARCWEGHGSYAWDWPTAAALRRRRVADVAALPLRPRARFVRAADAFWRAERLDAASSVLGVHLRGTDKTKGHVPVGRYLPLVRAYLCHDATAAILVATDDASMLAQFVAAVGAASPTTRVVWRRDASRGNGSGLGNNPAGAFGCEAKMVCAKGGGGDGGAACRQRAWPSQFDCAGGARRRPARPAAVGEDVLVDTLLLARAAFLLKSVSAVGEFAVYWSEGGRLLERSYDFNLEGRQPVPRWAGACGRRRPNQS